MNIIQVSQRHTDRIHEHFQKAKPESQSTTFQTSQPHN
jgi:hypothetical protein